MRRGVITSIRGGYNLSLRGKEKVKTVLKFLETYPPISGDLIKKRLSLLKRAIVILSKKKNRNIRLAKEESQIAQIRKRLKEIKKEGRVNKTFPKIQATQIETGKKENLLRLCDFFLEECPVRLLKNRERLRNLQRILNDYTPSPEPEAVRG